MNCQTYTIFYPEFARAARLGWTAALACFVLLLAGCTVPVVQAPAVAPQATEVSSAQQPYPSADDAVAEIQLIAEAGQFERPLDATPDPDASFVYFTASSPEGPGVFKVPAEGGDLEVIARGTPFVAPLGLAISTDGQWIYVADSEGDDGNGNAIFAVPAAGGTAIALSGTQGTSPRVPEVVSQDGMDQLYYSGVDPADGQPAVLKIPTAGGSAATVVVKGAPLVDPSGVAVTQAGVVYVVDRAASGNGMGSVFRVQDGAVETVVANIRTGDPLAGAALTLDESVLLVSALNPERDSAQVLLIAVATGPLGVVTKVVGENQGAGGVHRAYNLNQFAWCGVSGPGPDDGGGRVYRVAP